MTDILQLSNTLLQLAVIILVLFTLVLYDLLDFAINFLIFHEVPQVRIDKFQQLLVLLGYFG